MNHFGRVCWNSRKRCIFKEKNLEANIENECLKETKCTSTEKLVENSYGDFQAEELEENSEIIHTNSTEATNRKVCPEETVEVIAAETSTDNNVKAKMVKQFEDEKFVQRSRKKKKRKKNQAIDREAETTEVINDEAEESREHGGQEKLVESEIDDMEEVQKQKKEEILNEDAEDDENENIQEEEEMRGAKQKKGNVRRI